MLATATAAARIPLDHVDLLERPLVAALATLLPDGRPQTQPVWYSYDQPWVLINTMKGFRKERNLRADPRATLLVIDPENSSRWLEVRADAQLVDDGARRHLDELAFRYAGVRRFFGGSVSAELEETHIPVIGRLLPRHVVDESSGSRLVSARQAAARRPVSPRAATSMPATHLDLVESPIVAVLSTLLPSGRPQTQPVWFDFDGHDLLVNTTRERQKGRNLERDPRATLLIVDPADANRWIEVRADVEVSLDGALEHLDHLTRRYTPWPRYYGYIHSLERQRHETRILCRLIPRHVVCDAIFRSPTEAAKPAA